ncbi:MAG: hypothetical protein AVO33_08215 [delta proteobacterium ML8_F1]|nr:MAG: hypothetical protein AVO33_08215 [delta proteobacterium ML8_F1]
MIGITFEEKLLNHYTLEELMHLFDRAFFIRHFEISLQRRDLPRELIRKLVNQPYVFSYHIPYQREELTLDARHLATRPGDVLKSTAEILDFARTFIKEGPLSVVIHPAGDKNPYHNLRYMDFLLEYLEKKNLDLVLCLENIHNDYITYTPEDVHEIVREFATDRLKICLDVPNGILAGAQKPLSFKNVLHHGHVHGFNLQHRHIALDERSFRETDHYLKGLPGMPLVFELLGAEGYFEALEASLPWLRQLKTGP